jgi:fructose-1,6-bisphosphatase/inositol monophosphatase family enzyme
MTIDVDGVATIIREVAKEEILPRYRALGAGDVREKSGPMDLVTAADVAAEEALCRRLKEAFPGAAVVGEEAATEDPALLALFSKPDPLWVLDPVDGTINFAHGRPGFGVIVAYMNAGRAVAGWLHDPLEDVMVTAVAGGGAWCGPDRLKIPKDVPLSRMIGAAYGTISGRGRADAMLKSSGKIGDIRNSMCGAIDYIEIARGLRHFFLSPRSLPWDHAAGVLVIGEAGGIARFLDGSAYRPTIVDRPLLVSTDEPSWQALQVLLLAKC